MASLEFCSSRGVDIVIVIVGGGACKRSKLRDWNFPVGAEASFCKDLCELRAQRCVEKGDTTSNFAAQGVVESIVMWAMGTVE